MNLLERAIFAFAPRLFGHAASARLVSMFTGTSETGRSSSIVWSDKDKAFSISEGQFIVGDFRRLRKYLSGTKARGETLGRDYHLDNIVFEPNDVIIDCGANIGDLLLHLDTCNVQLSYIAIEPSHRDFRILSLNTERFPKIASELHNCALGAKTGKSIFYEASSTADSSVLPIQTFDQKYEVEVRSGCSIMGGRRIKLLKLEAEGFEPEVLAGFADCLPMIEYVSVDAGFERGIDMESTAPEVINFLTSNNYSLLAIGQARLTMLFVRDAIKIDEEALSGTIDHEI